MISNILTSFFNCLSVPILVLNHKFETVFTYNHDSDINNSLYISDKYDWKKISCVKDGELRTIEDIHEEIYNIVKENI